MAETDKIKITVKIAERPYKMTVNRNQESLVRKSAEIVNNTIIKHSKTFNYKDLQDLYIMTALESTVKAQRVLNEKEFREKDMTKKLKELDELLDSTLKNFDKVH